MPIDYESNRDSIILTDTNRTRFPIEWVIIFIIMAIAIIVLIILLVQAQSERIFPDQCPMITGKYGLIPANNGLLLNLCGSSGNQPCQSSQPTLNAAVLECERQSNICSRFSYNGATAIFSIISPTAALFNDETSDVFTRQNNFING